MTLETIKKNIDSKIERFIKVDRKPLADIARQMVLTKDNFKKLLEADVNSSTRTHMMQMYIDFAEKRVKDMEFIENRLAKLKFFAGASEEQFFKLIQFRDKVSHDVIQSSLF